ncbi:MAG: PKD domain-containing protein [Bacteroidetes bacterium]|nr:PKD domain-containing protein [Bacteroidota bacterium]MBU1718477.1 PKD domain-containing protein [Bacteroidota bacterium]
MKKIAFLFVLGTLATLFANAQLMPVQNPYSSEFRTAYNECPSIPRGLLEAVAFTNTRFAHLTDNTPESDIGLPRAYGVMGLTLDGKGYFRNNLLLVAQLSGISVNRIKANPYDNILAYAKAIEALAAQKSISPGNFADYLPVLEDLSELPVPEDALDHFCVDSWLYGIYSFLDQQTIAVYYHFPFQTIDMEALFGMDNLKVLSAKNVSVATEQILSDEGVKFEARQSAFSTRAQPDYAGAIWDPTTCNYSSRNGTTITAIAIHTVQGSYSGCISWFKNCSASASTHYVLRSSDGQVTQMVEEVNKAWHVGAENPYTIGYEHEGYVDNPAWYTIAMYQSSADLTRDICVRRSINPLRTFCRDTLDDGTALDYGIHSLGGDGSCIKIKGHQHYPNNTHTDPGPNWSWDLYYKLINNTPSITTITAASGSFYDTGGQSGPYGNDERKVWLIQPSGAANITLNFSSFDLEDNYDFLYIYDGATLFSPLIGRWNTQSPGTVSSTGGSMLVEFRSDCATTGAGWEATYTSGTVDATPPTTSVSSPGTWKTDDFTATFTDADNAGGSGVEKSYYQVIDYNGTEWRANNTRGFYADNFDSAINAEWTQSTGTWAISSGALVQSDEASSNTNIYTPLNQMLSNRYLYHFTMKVDGATTGKRVGMHFFSDSASLANRGNSYFIYFRLETSKLEFYSVTNDSYSQEKVIDNVVTTPGTWYDVKVFFDRTTGKCDVYRDDALIGSWTFLTLLATQGKYISFRTGNSNMSVGELKVYRSRYPTVSVAVGGGAADDIRYQNPDPATFSAKIKSIVNDANGNLSAIAYHDLNVDWTPPTDIVTINDGTSADVDTILVSSTLSANWTTSTDANSGLAAYWYAVGTTVGGTDLINWTSNATNTTVTVSGLSLTPGQIYYVSVKAENGAGLFSGVTTSDGQLVANSTLAGFSSSATEVCAGETIDFTNSSSNATSYQWIFSGGSPAGSTSASPSVAYNAAGTYTVKLTAFGVADSAVLEQVNYITVHPNPVATYQANDTVFPLPTPSVTFTNSSVDASSYYWSFGDGESSFDASPVHTYHNAGYYDVMLVASNAWCDDDTLIKTSYIHVLESTQAIFASTAAEICEDETVHYTNASENATSVEWIFEGGVPATSTDPNPIVSYPDNGLWDVRLIAYGSGDPDTVFYSEYVNVHIAPQSGFAVSDTIISVGGIVYFTNSSSNADSYFWSFGDGSTSTSTNPWHQYNAAGNYSVTLIAIGGICDPDTFSFPVVIQVLLAPVAEFTAADTVVCENQSVLFSDASVGATTWLWTFEGGNPVTSTLQNPLVSYSLAGDYNVSLQVTGVGGSDSAGTIDYITVNPLPVADFTVNDTVFQLPSATALFTNSSTDATTYFWDFGDMTTSTNDNPWHAYTAAGFYTVSLVAESNLCDNDTVTRLNYIHILDPVGISEIQEGTIQLVGGNQLIFIMNKEATAEIRTLDMSGRIIDAGKKIGIPTGKTVVEVAANTAQGIYLIEVRINEKSVFFRAMK